MTNITVNESLLGHINNDAYLTGSYRLQGNNFKNTIGYLSKFIAQYSGSKAKEIKIIIEAFQTLVTYEKRYEDLKKQEDIDKLSYELHEKIVKLEAGKTILIPGGWRKGKTGHAIIYKFHKDQSGCVEFHIHNTGKGIEYHQKSSSLEKELYNAILTYKIPNNKIADPEFAKYIGLLIVAMFPEIHKNSDYNAEYHYKKVIPRISCLNGNLFVNNCKNDKQFYTAGQLSGTCSQRVLHHMLKAIFPNQDDYRIFIYNFKVHALKDYIEPIKNSGKFFNPRYCHLIKKSIQHNLRILLSNKNHSKNEPLFDSNTIRSDLEKFRSYLAFIKSVKRQSQPNVGLKTIDIYKFDIGKLCFDRRIDVKILDIKSNNQHNLSYKEIPQFKPFDIRGAGDLFSDLQLLIKKCNDLN
jgi:hypothetical protein